MSDDKFTVDIEEELKKAAELSELKKKELEIKKYRTDRQYQAIQEAIKETDQLHSLDVTRPSVDFSQKLVKKSLEYFQGAKKRSQFLLNIPEGNHAVPFFAKNILVLGAVSGEGKSTACANICYSLLMQGKKPLVITNEESAEDVYNRVAALTLNVRYGNHDSMKEADIQNIHNMLGKLSERMHVIDNVYGLTNGFDVPNTTTTIEGFTFILDQLLERFFKDGFHYDAIIIDYFQSIDESRLNPSLDKVKILTKVSNKLDQFKNSYPAPIVVFGQLKSNSKENDLSAKDRLEWCKGLINRASCFIEIKANKRDRATEWILHKSRWSDFDSRSFQTGWEAGKFVPYNDEFKNKIAKQKVEKLEREISNGKKD